VSQIIVGVLPFYDNRITFTVWYSDTMNTDHRTNQVTAIASDHMTVESWSSVSLTDCSTECRQGMPASKPPHRTVLQCPVLHCTLTFCNVLHRAIQYAWVHCKAQVTSWSQHGLKVGIWWLRNGAELYCIVLYTQ